MTRPSNAELKEILDFYNSDQGSYAQFVRDITKLFQAREQAAYKKGYIDGSLAKEAEA